MASKGKRKDLAIAFGRRRDVVVLVVDGVAVTVVRRQVDAADGVVRRQVGAGVAFRLVRLGRDALAVLHHRFQLIGTSHFIAISIHCFH